jgi:hypothetical protein
MTRKEYFVRNLRDGSLKDVDMSPGFLCYVLSGEDKTKTAGTLWVQYDVTLFGTVA